jgi:hypothetical protein
MFDLEKFKKVIKIKSNRDLAKYYQTLLKRSFVLEEKLKLAECRLVIAEIKIEWSKRLEEGDQTGYPDEGLMSTMGYRVGDTQGIKAEYRKLIMSEILEGPIPFVNSPAYMREWGSDGSLTRFNKMQRFLNTEIHSPLQRNNYRAISEWKDDLAWLKVEGREFIISDD